MTAKSPTLPRNNPFPRNQVAKTSAPTLRAYYTESYDLVWAKLDDYFLKLPRPEGMAIGIRGSFGSGKTHLIYQLIDTLNRERPLDSKTIYAKAERPDILSLYRDYFVAEIDMEDFRNLLAHHLGRLIINKSMEAEKADAGRKTLLTIAAEEVSECLKTEPQRVLQMVTEDLLPMSGLQQELAAELKEDSEESLADDFLRVYLHLRDDNLKEPALRWLKGGKLSESERAGLALKLPAIATPTDAMQAMRLLLRAYDKASCVFMFCLDEFERWSSRGAPEDQTLAASLIKDLAETFKNTNQLLVVSGVDEAWESMSIDVFARIKPTDIIEMRLSDRDAREILNVYCQSQESSVLALFESRALSLLSQVSQHNVRQLLNIAHRSYIIAKDKEATQILPAHIKAAALEVLDDADDFSSVEQYIRLAANELGLIVHRNGTLGNLPYEYLLEGSPQLQIIVEVKRSIFILDEVETASKIALYIKTLSASFPQARYCVVIIGYSTNEIRDALSKIVDRLFYYDKDKFAGELIDYLRLRQAQSANVKKDSATFEEAFDEVGEEFDKLTKQRRAKVDQINEALDARESELVRLRNIDRERRATDRMIETLAELRSLIQSEKELGVREIVDEGEESVSATREKYERVIQLLDEQFLNIHRAELLNEKLSQAKEFALQLKELRSLTHKAESMWEAAYAQARKPDFSVEKKFPRSEVRRLYRDRKEILNKLEALHVRRSPRGAGGMFTQLMQALRQLSLSRGLILLSILLLCLYGSFMYLSWAQEKAVIDNYLSSLLPVQTSARKISLDPKSSGPDFANSLIESVAQLEGQHSSSKTLKYLYRYTPPDSLITDIKSSASHIKEDSDVPGNSYLRAPADNIIDKCEMIKRGLIAISFNDFALSYFAKNSLQFLGALIPLILAPFIIMFKRRSMTKGQKIY